jgi:ATP synthase protein I
MSETPPHGAGPGPAPRAEDPWAAFGYLVAGVLFYGLIGWVLSLVLHASYWIPIGLLVGAGLGIFMVFHRYRFQGDHTETDDLRSSLDPQSPQPRQPRPTGRTARPASDDQGETS